MWLTILGLGILTCLLLYKMMKKPPNYPPGPRGLPVAGNLFQVDDACPNNAFKAWWEKYGKIYSVKFGVHDMVVLSDVAEIKKAFAGNDFLDRPKNFLFQAMVYYKNAGISTSWGPWWQEHRNFTMRHLKDMGFWKSKTEDIVKSEVVEVINRIKEQNEEEEIELSWSLSVSISNTMWIITSGKRLDPTSVKMHKFHQLIQDLFKLFAISGLVDAFPWLEYIIPKSWLVIKEFNDLTGKFYDFFQEEIDEHKLDFDENSEDRDLIDSYLRRFKEKGSEPGFDKELEEFNLLAVVGDLFSAGGESTYTTVRWAFLYLIKYPNVQKRIQEDIDALTAGSRMPCLEDKSKLAYVEAFMNEVQRHANILPVGFPHRSTADTTILGYKIPKGTQLVAYMTGCLYSPEIWGDPENFRPERFLDENGEIKKFEGFIPFSIGRRACPGEHLARLQIYLLVTCILQQFHLESVTGNPDDVSLEAENETFFRYPMPYKMKIRSRKQ